MTSNCGRELLPYDGSVILYENFMGPTEANAIFDQLFQQVPWQQTTVRVFGQEHLTPRLTAWFGNTTYKYSSATNQPVAWLPALEHLRAIAQTETGHLLNGALCNLYRNGHDTVGWHADDEPELGPQPTIVSFSFGATRKFRLRHQTTAEVINVDLDSGSMVVMRGLTQQLWRHCIPRQLRVYHPRINVTFRTLITTTQGETHESD